VFVAHSAELAGGAELCLDELLRGLKRVTPSTEFTSITPQSGPLGRSDSPGKRGTCRGRRHRPWVHVADASRRERIIHALRNVAATVQIVRLVRRIRPEAHPDQHAHDSVRCGSLRASRGSRNLARSRVRCRRSMGCSSTSGRRCQVDSSGDCRRSWWLTHMQWRRRLLSACHPASCVVVHYGVEAVQGQFIERTRRRQDREVLRALIAGRVVPGKGLDVAVAGVAEAARPRRLTSS